jgi:hypothetical protein
MDEIKQIDDELKTIDDEDLRKDRLKDRDNIRKKM